MSSRSGKHHPKSGKAVDRSTEWSEWIWDPDGSRWYSYRQNSNGAYEYQYQETTSNTSSVPRTSSVATITPSTATKSTGKDVAYSSNENYGYETSQYAAASSGYQQPSSNYGGVDTLTSGIGNVSISDRPQLTQASSYSTYGASTGSSGYIDSGSRPITSRSTSAPDGYYDYSSSGYSSLATPTEYNTSFTSTSQAGPSSFYPASTATSGSADFPGTKLLPIVSGSGAIAPKQSQRHHITSNTLGTEERLDSRFKVHSSSYFKPLQVFKVLWSEPEGSKIGTDYTDLTRILTEDEYGEKIYTSVRRFVIVAADNGHCQCIPILTYGRQGCTKPGVKKIDHAIIYTGKPPSEIKGENLPNKAIEVVPATARDKLAPESRVNYSKLYTVEHNVKVHFIGRIADSSRRRFMTEVDAAWDRKRKYQGS